MLAALITAPTDEEDGPPAPTEATAPLAAGANGLGSASTETTVAESDSVEPAEGSELPEPWVCDDPDDDLVADFVGEPTTSIPGEDRPWVEVESLTLTRSGTDLVAVWELADTIPDDIGSSPGWGDYIASWTVVFWSKDFEQSSLVAVDKVGSNPLRLLAERSHSSADEFESINLTDQVDAQLELTDGTLTISVPMDVLSPIPREVVIGAEAAFDSPQGDVDNGDFFAGWRYLDPVCAEGGPSDWPVWAISGPTD